MRSSLLLFIACNAILRIDSLSVNSNSKCRIQSFTKKQSTSRTRIYAAEKNDNNDDMKNEQQKMEYKNVATSFLSNFMNNGEKATTKTSDSTSSSVSEEEEDSNTNPILSKIDFKAPKISKVPIETLALILDAELYEKEWFVTGNVNPVYFDDTFEFQDPDVKLSGIEDYAKGVNKLFDQETSRAEIISTKVNTDMENTITVTWRLSGKVNIGPGLTIKPYICYTDFTVDSEGSGLITMQEDRFDIPQWDILLSALFPFLIGKVTSDPAPPVPVREVPQMPKNIGVIISSNSSSSSVVREQPIFQGLLDVSQGLLKFLK